jgi:ADP-ribose pyrophosphatase YjhB (NUDIX family)
MNKSSPASIQYAALPYRRGAGVALEVMLITSRGTGRWIIPKGWPVERLAPHDSAAQEAREEGGLVGRVGANSIGRYHYDKQMEDGSATACVVDVFALEVEEQLPHWLEQEQRHTRWFALQEAAEAVQEPELAAIIRNLAALLP